MDLSNFLGPSTPSTGVRPAGKTSKKKYFRKCDPQLVEKAWGCFWDPEFVEASDAYHKMQWTTLREAMAKIPGLKDQAKKITAAYLYIFACWSAANPGVPLYPLIRGAKPKDPQLLKELKAAPRLNGVKTCKFLWKDKAVVPESLKEFAGWGQQVWQLELLEAEKRAALRIKKWRDEQKNTGPAPAQ